MGKYSRAWDAIILVNIRRSQGRRSWEKKKRGSSSSNAYNGIQPHAKSERVYVYYPLWRWHRGLYDCIQQNTATLRSLLYSWYYTHCNTSCVCAKVYYILRHTMCARIHHETSMLVINRIVSLSLLSGVCALIEIAKKFW